MAKTDQAKRRVRVRRKQAHADIPAEMHEAVARLVDEKVQEAVEAREQESKETIARLQIKAIAMETALSSIYDGVSLASSERTNPDRLATLIDTVGGSLHAMIAKMKRLDKDHDEQGTPWSQILKKEMYKATYTPSAQAGTATGRYPEDGSMASMPESALRHRSSFMGMDVANLASMDLGSLEARVASTIANNREPRMYDRALSPSELLELYGHMTQSGAQESEEDEYDGSDDTDETD